MFFRENSEVDLGETLIDNIFIDIFMPMANGAYVKVYLLGYRYVVSGLSSDNINNQTIAKNLNIPLSDVLDAWDFWEKKNIIKKHKKDATDWDYSIEFLSLKKIYIENILVSSNTKKTSLDMDDFLSASTNTDIQKMFSSINDIISRELTPNEKKLILDILTNYNMSPEMIKSAFSYAKQSKGIKNVKYIEAIIRNWHDAKIFTIEDLAEQHAKKSERFGFYKYIFKELGFSREPSKPEKDTMDKWFDDYKLNMNIITKACAKTKNISSPSIGYVDSIVSRWHEKGLQSIEEIDQDELEKPKRVTKNEKPASSNTIKTKFHNFEERYSKYTPEEFERIALENQKKKFK